MIGVAGDMLLSVSMTSAVTSIVMDNMETCVWVGDNKGDIHRICLLTPPRDVCVTSDTCNTTTLLRGHDTSVTMLSLSCDSLTLASGDSQGALHLWDANSGVCTYKLLKYHIMLDTRIWRQRIKPLLCRSNSTKHPSQK